MTDNVFESSRQRLMAVAYGMLGSVMDAEDIVQDAWLRWSTVDRSDVREPLAFLTTMVTRMSIDWLRSARHRREQYVGPWLPEPIVSELSDDPADRVAEAEALSLGFLTALERLNPVERAVLLLRDGFDFDYSEIAEMLGKTIENCRQIASRARGHVGRPARESDRDLDHDQAIVSAAMAAVTQGDIDRLVDLLAADVISWSDGGPKRRAARHPISGAHRVSIFLTGIAKQGFALEPTFRFVRANGWLAVAIDVDGSRYGVMAFDIVDDRIQGILHQVNPDKLAHV